MTEADVEWLNYICKKRYSHAYDSVETEKWFRNRVLTSPMMFHPVRTADAFCITMLSVVPWTPLELDANVVFICADDDCLWQAMRLLRSSIDWAKRRRCTVWRLSSDTGYDFRMLARRLGATELEPRYLLRL